MKSIVRFFLFGMAVLFGLPVPFLILWISSQAQPVNNSEYREVVAHGAAVREEFRRRYADASTPEEQKQIVEEARQFLFNFLTDTIFPAWIGTPWSFNGNTREPKKGSVACGVLVVNTLRDAGFRIPVTMSRQPSENIIKNLVGTQSLRRFSNSAPMSRVQRWIVKNGEGIYLVGLDIHVGFIIYKNETISFFHSSYYNPPLCVVNQDISEKSPLTDSRYRVLGKLLTDEMVVKWIRGETFPLKYDYFRRPPE